MDMNNMQKTPEQQIDEAVEISKALFLPNARNPHEAEKIKRPGNMGCCIPNCALRRRKKSNRKRKRSNAFSSATPVFLFKIASALREIGRAHV